VTDLTGNEILDFSPLSSESIDKVILTSTSLEFNLERSGGTVPSSVEKRRDPDYMEHSGALDLIHFHCH
jgi:hypothetical protein